MPSDQQFLVVTTIIAFFVFFSSFLSIDISHRKDSLFLNIHFSFVRAIMYFFLIAYFEYQLLFFFFRPLTHSMHSLLTILLFQPEHNLARRSLNIFFDHYYLVYMLSYTLLFDRRYPIRMNLSTLHNKLFTTFFR